MVMPQAMASSCPQCGANVRAASARCDSCGFWLAATPAPRTSPPEPRPRPIPPDSRRTTLLVLGGGGVIVVALLALGGVVWLRQPDPARISHAAPAAAPLPVSSSTDARLEPSNVLVEAHRRARDWHRDAVLVSLRAGPLDARGVVTGGEVEVAYAKPNEPRVSGGAETGSERLVVRADGGPLSSRVERLVKARIAPEPHCLFEDAWASAQRAGDAGGAPVTVRYLWSDKHARPVWEVLNGDGHVLRRLDGVSCRILTR